jgi:hypothetical protein
MICKQYGPIVIVMEKILWMTEKILLMTEKIF